MKPGSKIFIIFFSVLLYISYSCSPQPCYQDTVATIKANFYRTGTGTTVTADSVTLYGAGRDTSKIYDAATGISSIAIPLDAGSDSSSFVIKIDTLTDVITFYYSRYTHLISKECGYTFYYNLTKPVKHSLPLPDFLIINTDITTGNAENIRIFF